MSQPELIASRYRVVRAVGKGGMGTVWLCTDETLHRRVAVKQIGSLPGESPDVTARAMREARLAAALNHENAVSIFDVVEHDGSTWLVMEYVPSQTLSQLLASEGRLPPARVVHIGTQVAAALSSAHALGIVHRDIKPGNILVGDGDAAKISDFGIARGHQDTQLTQTGMVSGTPAFFSPELARGEDPTFASDVWAFGITLYTATEGSPPYELQANPLAMLSTITRDPLPPPTNAGPLAGVLAGMLNPDVSQRSTMAETLAALRKVEKRGVAAWDATTAVASPPASYEQPYERSVVQDRVEPAYEKSVTVPAVAAVSSSWSDEGAGSEPPPDRERSSFGRILMAVLAVLVLVGAGALLWNTLGIGAGDEPKTTSADPSNVGVTKSSPAKDPSTSPTAAPDTATEQSTTPTSTPPKTKPPKTKPPKTEPTVNPPSSSPEDFAQSYFSIVPGDLDAGWSQLAPSFQAQIGRTSYDNFWGSVESVSVGGVDAIDDATVRYEITYAFSDGSTSDETKQLILEANGDSYLITGDTTVG